MTFKWFKYVHIVLKLNPYTVYLRGLLPRVHIVSNPTAAKGLRLAGTLFKIFKIEGSYERTLNSFLC